MGWKLKVGGKLKKSDSGLNEVTTNQTIGNNEKSINKTRIKYFTTRNSLLVKILIVNSIHIKHINALQLRTFFSRKLN